MREVSTRELKARASELLRDVRDRRTRYLITHRGRPIAVLAPIEAVASGSLDGDANAWDELARLGEEIGRGWTSPLSSAELISAARREPE